MNVVLWICYFFWLDNVFCWHAESLYTHRYIHDDDRAWQMLKKCICAMEIIWNSGHLSVASVAAAFKHANKAERQLAIDKLRNEAVFRHNRKVLTHGEGNLIVARRSQIKRPPADYLPCSYCYCFFRAWWWAMASCQTLQTSSQWWYCWRKWICQVWPIFLRDRFHQWVLAFM